VCILVVDPQEFIKYCYPSARLAHREYWRSGFIVSGFVRFARSTRQQCLQVMVAAGSNRAFFLATALPRLWGVMSVKAISD